MIRAQEKEEALKQIESAHNETYQIRQDLSRVYDIRRYDSNFMTDAVVFLKRSD